MGDTESHGDGETFQKFANRWLSIILKSIFDLLAKFHWLVQLSFESNQIDNKKE